MINNIRLIAASVVLIIGGGFWALLIAGIGVMVFDSPTSTFGTYLSEVIPLAALGLIAVVLGFGQLIKLIIGWRRALQRHLHRYV